MTLKKYTPFRSLMLLCLILQLVTATRALGLDAETLPTGGSIVSGTGSIQTSGATMTVNQGSQQLIATWDSFNIGQKASVNFAQPGTTAVALNRITDQSPSQILGSLSANGQVFLINPSGIIFGSSAQVNVGGLVASTLDIADEDFLNGSYSFYGSDSGSIGNAGTITVSNGGYVAFLSPHIDNSGTVTADGGSVAMAAATRISLDLADDGLIAYSIDQRAVDALVDNSGLVQADGGLIYLSAEAADELTGAAVNNTGIIQARTLEEKEGKILLVADKDTGSVSIGGTLDASAPTGGDGGFIETSAAAVNLTADAEVSTLAANGTTGTWLIDPTDFTIAASGGDMTGDQVEAALAATNLTIESAGGSSEGAGDIYVNDTIAWSTNTLTLSAYRNIEINSELTATGTAALALEYGQGATNGIIDGSAAGYWGNAPVNLAAGSTFTTRLGSSGELISYSIITTAAQLEAIVTALSGNYVLGENLDLNGGTVIGSAANPFTGIFDGLGHTLVDGGVTALEIDYIGLFGYNSGTIRNLIAEDWTSGGADYVGTIAGYNDGIISNCRVTNPSVGGASWQGGLVGYNAGTVTDSRVIMSGMDGYCIISTSSNAGGLAGGNSGTITNSSCSYTNEYLSGLSFVSSPNDFGGLVGHNSGTISGSHVSADFIYLGHYSGNEFQNLGGLAGSNSGVIFDSYADIPYWDGENWNSSGVELENLGGLVGHNSGTISNSYASGGVARGDQAGGLVGTMEAGTISDSYATSGVPEGREYAGGLVGLMKAGTISNSYATGDVFGNWGDYPSLGGLVGQVESGTITGSYAIGDVYNISEKMRHGGGLVGYMSRGRITDSYATGAVSRGTNIGGLVGTMPAGTISNSYATGKVFWGNYSGGLVGSNSGPINNSYATGKVSGAYANGGLVGYNYGTINNSYATGDVSGGNLRGGLAGRNDDTIINSYWDTATTDQTVGVGYGTTIDNDTYGVTGQSNSLAFYRDTLGWDIDDAGSTGTVWRIYDGYTTPLLRSFLTPLILTATKVYNSTTSLDEAVYTWSMETDDDLLLGSAGTWETNAINAGSCSFDTSGYYSTQQGYDITGQLTISPAALTITANDAVVSYDGSAYSGGIVSYSGFVAGEDTANLAGSLVYGGSSQGAVNAGSYTISASGLSADNYDITYQDGKLSINPAAITLSTSDVSKVYDGTLSADGTAVVTAGSLFGDDSLSGGSFHFTDADAGTGKTVTVSDVTVADGNSGGNYSVSYQNNTSSTITRAALTITAYDEETTYDGSAYSGGNGFSYSGFAAGEDASALDGSLAYGGDSQGAVNAGSYTISASGLSADNYDITYVDGQLTISPAPLTITANDSETTYDGSAYSGGNVSYSGFVAGEDASALDGSLAYGGDSQGAVNAGSYTISASGLSAGNYDITYVDGQLTISPAPLTITANDSETTYDGSAYSGGNGVSYSGFAAEDDASALDGTLVYAGSSQGAVNAGSYTISASGLGSDNYTIAYRDGRLAIVPTDAGRFLATLHQQRQVPEISDFMGLAELISLPPEKTIATLPPQQGPEAELDHTPDSRSHW
ncbi:MBG domain-containing protein [uncultured Desulfuromonas sp.]|uniref:MBG domain-containing protein n=1 Tax=uncultured Desulfuromonas sp. TaxID=181013 RepID=UPI002AAC455C|nr:MBG domain-containing protein [uncultured Desulfuromonas sp.]